MGTPCAVTVAGAATGAAVGGVVRDGDRGAMVMAAPDPDTDGRADRCAAWLFTSSVTGWIRHDLAAAVGCADAELTGRS
ncbi:hypothetical protein GCM10010336_19880 [Streptomyces goshikiensis]|nr:hypothetical protein GCM10010336_19880 [Streptomyces goshikiensis]